MDSIKNINTIHETEEEYAVLRKDVNEVEGYSEEKQLLPKDTEFNKINELYDECVTYLKQVSNSDETADSIVPDYESIGEKQEHDINNEENQEFYEKHQENHEAVNNKTKQNMLYKIENELISNESLNSCPSEPRSERLRKLSQQLPKIIITQSNTSLNVRKLDDVKFGSNYNLKHNNIKKGHKSLPKINLKYEFQNNNFKINESKHRYVQNDKYKLTEDKMKIKCVAGNGKKTCSGSDNYSKTPPRRPGEVDFPKRLVSKRGIENVALISNVPFERIRLLNDTFHTLINLRWRWIVTGTIVVHFAIWLVFAVFWYIAALAHYDFEPDPPKRSCVTGGHDFLTIFLASVEAQTTIGFGDRAIDEECPESIFLFIMQLILGTGLSGVLTCVVYAKLTRPEKLSRDGVGFSKKAVISARDGRLCLMMRAWDLNYDHIISSEFTAHFVHTHRTKEGEVIRYYAKSLALQQRQFLLWPVTLLHVIDRTSPLYGYGPDLISNSNYEITVSLKGASASMGTFTQSQTSYLPREVVWGHRFPPVVKYEARKQMYVIDHKKLDMIEPVDTPPCSAQELDSSKNSCTTEKADVLLRPSTPSSFSEKISSFQLDRSSSFRKNTVKHS